MDTRARVDMMIDARPGAINHVSLSKWDWLQLHAALDWPTVFFFKNDAFRYRGVIIVKALRHRGLGVLWERIGDILRPHEAAA